MVANVSDTPLVIPKWAVLGVAEQVSEALVERINARNQSDSSPSSNPKENGENEALYQKP